MTDSYKKMERDPKNVAIAAGPHVWIQWKGTDVCMDVYCECGTHGHIDGDFTYSVKCADCGRAYQVSPWAALIPATPEDLAGACDAWGFSDSEEDELHRPDPIADAKAEGAQQERERIVRWLRYHEWPGNIPFPGMLAEMIEQGAHEEEK